VIGDQTSSVEGPATVMIQPEHVELVGGGLPEALSAVVRDISCLGSEIRYELELDAQTKLIASKRAAGAPLGPGERTTVRWARQHAVLLRQNGAR
jgi:ABC-type Fe3+/spermidine/putrescine transport system ATPase subunit